MKVTFLAILVALQTSRITVDAQVQYGDRWNYDETIQRDDGFTDYGPSDWEDISCDESSREGLDECIAYIDKWHEGEGWRIERNYCRSCPEDSPGSCGRHRNSPINLQRNRGLGYWGKTEENNGSPGANADPLAKECIDVHWMKYEDAFCPLDQMIEKDAFTIERHALRVNMPIIVDDSDTVEMDCIIQGKGRRFGRIDFSKGFSQWWFLSHIDIHATSEHTQEGKRYDAELQMHHFYSVPSSVSGVDNEVATVGMFMQVYDNVPPYRDLDKILCLWRRKEYETRLACGLDPVEQNYPGCFPYQKDRKLRKTTKTSNKRFSNVMDLYHAQHKLEQQLAMGMNVSSIPKLRMDPENWGPAEMDEEGWAKFIAEQSAMFKADDELWALLHKEFNDTAKAHEEYHVRGRRLMGGDELQWFNYWPMLGVRTEYYYRYSGTQTTPPCYGEFDSSSRKGTNHWRFLKDPIRIHQRQLDEMRRLLRERIAPPDDPVMACKPDTAAKVDGDVVSTARPLQYEHESHFMVFCECKDWPSKWPEDREWCRIDDVYERFYDTPYSFRTNGF